MTTAEYITSQTLGCSSPDIETLFGKLSDNDFLSVPRGVSARELWLDGIDTAMEDIFGTEVEYDIYFNFIDSHVSVAKETAECIEDFWEKAS